VFCLALLSALIQHSSYLVHQQGPPEADDDSAAFKDIWCRLKESEHRATLVYNSGRNLSQVYQIYEEKRGLMPKAQVLVCGVGTRIYELQDRGKYTTHGHAASATPM